MYLATEWTKFASFHPLVYTAKMKMVGAFCNNFWIFRSIFCKYKR